MELVKLDDFESLDDNIAFHYTTEEFAEDIFSDNEENNGLRGKIGPNSSGLLGKEAIEKSFISYGRIGQLQLFNRMLNAARQATLKALRANTRHSEYLPQVAKSKIDDDRLSPIESFEFMRQYGNAQIYIALDAKPTVYEKELTQKDIDDINNAIYKRPDYIRIREIDDSVNKLYEELVALKNDSKSNDQRMQELRNEINQLYIERRKLSIDIRTTTLEDVNAKRGNMLEEGIFDVVDFNEEYAEWRNQIYRTNEFYVGHEQHNVHSRIINVDGKLLGVIVRPNESQRMGVVTLDGNRPATANEVIRKILNEMEINREMAIPADPLLLGLYQKYLDMVDKYRKNGLLVTDEQGKEVVDIEHLEKYEGLEEFSRDLPSMIEEMKEKRIRKPTVSTLTRQALESNGNEIGVTETDLNETVGHELAEKITDKEQANRS